MADAAIDNQQHRGAPSGDSVLDDGPADPRDVIRRLQSLLTRVRTFMERQTDRLRDAHAVATEAHRRIDETNRQRDDLQFREREWDEHRRRQTEIIDQHQNQLTAAWERLEAERRALLSRQPVAAQQLAPPPAPAIAPSGVPPLAQPPIVQPAAESQPLVAASSERNSASELGIDPYKLLKKDISAHARRRSGR